MGGGRPKKKVVGGRTVETYGSVVSTEESLSRSERGVVKGALIGALTAIGALLFPQFALAIYAAYYAYLVARHALAMKEDYDKAGGTPEERTIVVALKEGVRIGLGAAIGAEAGMLMGPQLHDKVVDAVHITSSKFGEAGVFATLATVAGGSASDGEDLRYLYTSTATRVSEGAISGAGDEISQYIAEKVVE